MTQSPTPTDQTQEDRAQEDRARDDEAALNAILNKADVPAPPEALKRDILAAYDNVQQQRRDGFAGIGNLFERFRIASAAALASISVLGLTAGAITANSGVALAPEDELYIYADDTFDLALLDDEELDRWAGE